MQTDLNAIKSIAIDYLKLKPCVNDEYPFIVYHPFISNNPTLFKENDKFIFIDVINSKKNFNMYIKQKKEDIKSANNFDRILMMMNKTYYLLFLKLITMYLSKEDYNKYLKYIWTNTEFPNGDKNVAPAMSLNLFKNSDKQMLMTSDELVYLQKLPNEVTIYRGTYNKDNSNALSWTDNYDIAKWFAKRFDGNIVIKSTINKEDILACFKCRNENELIIDYTKIKNIEIEKIKDINI